MNIILNKVKESFKNILHIFLLVLGLITEFNLFALIMEVNKEFELLTFITISVFMLTNIFIKNNINLVNNIFIKVKNIVKSMFNNQIKDTNKIFELDLSDCISKCPFQ